MFCRGLLFARWGWATLVVWPFVLLIIYLAFIGYVGAIIWGILISIAIDIQADALPVFARVRIGDDEIELGTLLTTRKSLKNVKHYQTSREDRWKHTVRFALHKGGWTGCILFLVDEEDELRLTEYLQERGIGDLTAYLEQLSLEANQASEREIEASTRA